MKYNIITTIKSRLGTSIYRILRGILFRFLRNEDQQRSWGIVWGTLQRHWRIVLVVFCINLVAALFEGSTFGILSIALAVLTQGEQANLNALLGKIGMLSQIIPKETETAFLLLVALAVITQIARSLLQFAAQIVSVHMANGIRIDVTSRAFRQCMIMSFAEVNRYSIGDLRSYLAQVASLVNLVTWTNQFIRTLLLSLAYVGVMFWISFDVTLIVLPLMILLSLGLRFIMVHIYEISKEITRLSIAFNVKTIELIQAIRVVRTFAREEAAIEQVDKNVAEQAKYLLKAQQWRSLVIPIIETSTLIGVSTMLVGGYLMLGAEGARAIFAEAAVFLLMLYRLVPQVSSINTQIVAFYRMLPDLERATSFLRVDDKEYERKDGKLFRGLHESIDICNLSFRYREDVPWALNNISFSIPKGRMVALVGVSGAGKSTMVDLLLGVYKPTEGQILVDGTDLHDFNPKSWRRCLGMVSQSTFIFNATVRENITFPRPNASDEEVIAAAKIANAHDFIMETEDGYETLLGNQGYRLSGGQRQRIAIARAIIHDPSILILDEATSALDSEAERLIQDAIDNLRGERTIIAIAHRLSTIRKADNILVLHQGELVESGTHEELLQQNKRYAYLWYLQSE
jgi:ATP-binding cassette subfamily B protein/subfamily B ATP-binding cassette protein MsbA